MLIDHRIDDVDERLVAGEQAVAPGQQVTLQPSLTEMLAQDLEHATVGAEIDVDIFDRRHPFLAGGSIDRVQPVGCGLVRPE